VRSLIFNGDSFVNNPLDIAEGIITRKGWPCERLSDEDVAFELIGLWSDTKAWLYFKPELSALMLTCTFDTKVPFHLKHRFYELLALMNERVWLGAFDLSSTDNSVSFRYTLLLDEKNGASHDQLDQMIAQAYSECEKYYPTVQSVIWGSKAPRDAMTETVFDTVGEA